VAEVRSEHPVSERRACRLIGIQWSVQHYQAKPRDNQELVELLQELSESQPRWGFSKMFYWLRNRGYGWNHKRVYRVYCAMKLNLRIRRRRRLPKRFPDRLEPTKQPNECWSMDFMSDSLLSGQRFRTLNVIDDYNREALAIEVDTSLPGQRVVRVLERIADWRGYPRRIRIDNGPEFISTALMQWGQDHNVLLEFIQPGQPAQNAYIERFNRTFREDVLDLYLFQTLKEVRKLTQQWMSHYNQDRPHDALDGQTPTAFALAAAV
jgi:putative transposase